MYIIPAIDILDNRVVRLEQGDMSSAKDYGLDPLELAKLYQEIGVKRLHIVDLNAARGESKINMRIIEKIAAQTEIDIELGGGVREIDRAIELDNAGVKYFILGTIAVKAPDKTKRILDAYPNRVILGLDAKGANLATDGWYTETTVTIAEVIERYKDFNVEGVVYTDISKDGMLLGLNLEMIDKVASSSKFPIIASGGVSSEKDIYALAALKNSNIIGVIIGKAIYENKLDLKKLLQEKL